MDTQTSRSLNNTQWSALYCWNVHHSKTLWRFYHWVIIEIVLWRWFWLMQLLRNVLPIRFCWLFLSFSFSVSSLLSFFCITFFVSLISLIFSSIEIYLWSPSFFFSSIFLSQFTLPLLNFSFKTIRFFRASFSLSPILINFCSHFPIPSMIIILCILCHCYT